MSCGEECHHPEVIHETAHGPHHCLDSHNAQDAHHGHEGHASHHDHDAHGAHASHHGHGSHQAHADYAKKEELLSQHDCECKGDNRVLTDIPEPPTIHRDKYAGPMHEPHDTTADCGSYVQQETTCADNMESMPRKGTVDWSPLAALTGTRPGVDRNSITRFSPGEWQDRNLDVLHATARIFENTNRNDNDCRNAMARTTALVDKTQANTTKKLQERARLVNKWRNSLERTIQAMIDEIVDLEETRQRLKQAMLVLKMPESICNECLALRCIRPDTELVRDGTEEALLTEYAMLAEIRRMYNQTLNEVEKQLAENRAMRHRLEVDWSDKDDAYKIECTNIALNNLSLTKMFKPGAAKLPEQSCEEHWEHYSKDNLGDAEQCRLKSYGLRATVDAILMNASRDMRAQADNVERAFQARIASMFEIESRLVHDLEACVQKLAETEIRIDSLSQAVLAFNEPMKVAQSRLDNRYYRPGVENCRDLGHASLVEEVEVIETGMSNIRKALDEAESIKNDLVQTRGQIEREIMLKRRAIMIDSERCMNMRAQFPSTNALSGLVK